MDIHHHKLLRCGRWLAIVEMPIAKNCQYLDTITYHWGENQCWPRSQEGLRGVPERHTSFPTILPGWWFEPLWKTLVKWEGWHPIYEMDNQKCLKPPTSCRWAEPPTFQLSGGCHLLVTSQPVLRPFGSAEPKRPNTAFLTGLTDTVSKKTPKKYNSALGANIFPPAIGWYQPIRWDHHPISSWPPNTGGSFLGHHLLGCLMVQWSQWSNGWFTQWFTHSNHPNGPNGSPQDQASQRTAGIGTSIIYSHALKCGPSR